MALPSGYTPLEYIESTGSQYVDTGFAPGYTSGYRIDFQLTTASSSDLTLMGSLNPNICFLCGNGQFEYAYKSGTGASGSFGANDTKRHVLSLNFRNDQKAILDQTSKVLTAMSENNAKTAYIFASHYDNPVVYGQISARVFRVEMSNGADLVRDFIPCTNPSGEVGLYDDVNGVFYGDAAGIGFVAGPVAAQPEAPASLEVIGTTRNAAILAWPAAPVGQSYRLYRDGVVVYEGSALCYTDTGLAAGSTHVYSIHTLSGSTESEGVTTEATTTEGIVLITDRTASDVSAGRRKGYYNALDLIRVGEAMVYLEERFAAVGISVTVSPKLDWQLADIPTHAQALHYLTDIGVLRGKLTEFRETVSLPGSLTALTWGQANDIEAILLDAEKLIRDIVLSYRHYSGRTISGVNALP